MLKTPEFIRLLLVNETRLMGNVITAALEDEPDIGVVACVTEAAEALEILQRQKVDVALVSALLPEQGALQLTRAIAARSASTKILVLGMTEDKKHVLRYVEAGAAGYVLRNDSLEGLIETVRAAQAGRVLISPEIAAALVQRLWDLAQVFSEFKDRTLDSPGLTHRELEILELIGKRMTNQQIAGYLVIEVGTVKNHVHNILEKLNVDSRREAAACLALIRK